MKWHSIGIALGGLAVALAAFASYSLPDDYGKYVAALAGACAAGSTYLLHAYPVEDANAPSPPQQAP